MSDARICPLVQPADPPPLAWPSAALAVLALSGLVWLGLVMLIHVAAVLPWSR